MMLIHDDELHSIILTPDGTDGIVIQLVSKIPRLLPNAQQFLEEHLSLKSEFTEIVKLRNGGVLDPNFKANLAAAIKRCEHQLTIRQQNKQYIDGALKDYVR